MTAKIVLVGNSTSANRGCQAIALGTLALFREVLGPGVNMRSGVIVPAGSAGQGLPAVSPKEPPQIALVPRPRRSIVRKVMRRLFGQRSGFDYRELGRLLDGGADLVLEVGGDNYTLDYGRPYSFIDLDHALLGARLPLMIWGASVGPFNADPLFEKEIMGHFSRLRQVFVRETISEQYLKSCGLENVTLMADPAIAMQPEAPAKPCWDVDRSRGAIGLNLSPFQARQIAGGKKAFWDVTEGDIDRLAAFGAELVSWVVAEFGREVVLVPHVMAAVPWNNDYGVLSKVVSRLDPSTARRVQLLPDTLTAPELKWAMSELHTFVGSRTHATLGAISSGIPTAAFSYSRKSIGLMRDLYGHDEFCLGAEALSQEGARALIERLVASRDKAALDIANTLPTWRRRAREAVVAAVGMAGLQTGTDRH
ncbi:MAG: polysaccharide pyruvyl transferase family protein [Hyphomicrobium sp.]|nr:polysaccharide pyruvyl transferase family protein [Hyphomicrobium sp.]